jgi:hypothetical protein
MGHWFKGKSVNDRYGRIGDQELLDAIDKMTFDPCSRPTSAQPVVIS